MTAAPALSTPPKRSRFRRLIFFLVAAALLVVVGIGISLAIATHSARARLDAIIARLDSTDPHWRLHDLDIDQKPLADDQNNALLVQKILEVKPGNWPDINVQNQLDGQNPQERLTPEQAQLLKTDLARSAECIALVRRLAALPYGYVKIDWPPDGVSTLLPVVVQAREIARIASFDAKMRAEERDFDGALESCRAILSASRANEPCCTLIQLLVRIAIQAVCLGQVERVLAQGEASDAALAAMKKLLEDELAQPLLSQSLRGERALGYWIMESTYRKNPSQVILMNISSAWAAKTDLASRIAAVALSPFGGSIDANEAASLEGMTEFLELSKRPEAEQASAFNKLQALSVDWRQPVLFRGLLPTVMKVREAYLRSRARLLSTVVAIAAERYRRKHNAWPNKIEAMIPTELAEVPTDPYDGQPLRLLRLKDGLVIYSVGADGVDDGGKVHAVNALPADLGFRLWDVTKRGQKPTPKPVEADPEN